LSFFFSPSGLVSFYKKLNLGLEIYFKDVN